MIIDQILDRKDGYGYEPKEFYLYCNGYNEHGNNIARAMDAGTNKDIQRAICEYITDNGYSSDICDYVNAVYWLWLVTSTNNPQTSKTMKTANGIIRQSKNMMAQLDKTAPEYSTKLRRIAEIGRAYLHNIARHCNKPYGAKTWSMIGDNELPRAIYAGY